MQHISPYYYRRQRQKKEFLLPFLIIICIGIIIILITQLVFSFLDDNKQDLSTKISVYSIGDSIQILPGQQTDWIKGYNGSILVAGDTLRTGAATKAVLQFNDGNLLRINENTQLVINQLTHSKKNGIHTLIELSYGEMWMNKKSFDGDYVLKINNGRVYSVGTIFAIDNKANEILRVLQGNVQFDVTEQQGDNIVVLESYVVGIGQQLTLNEDALESIKERKVVDLIAALSNEWETSSWHNWNVQEDQNPTDFASPTADTTNNAVVENLNATENQPKTEEEETPQEIIKEKPVVFVTKPSTTPFTLNAEKYVLQGAIKGYAKSVVVDSVNGKGVKDVYTLSKFTAGSSTWNYTVFKDYNNLTEGLNKYTVYAKDENGQISEKVTVEINVPVGTFKVEEEKPSQEVIDSMSALLLSVVSFNGESNLNNRYETTEERVEIIGSATLNISKVYVNGFQLTQYSSGSGQWKYFAKTEFDNLHLGENYFSVYGVDNAGNKTSTVNFVIVKK